MDRVAAALAGADPATPTAPRHLRTGDHDRRALRGISTDTRAIRAGDCFVALAGEHFDAHDFLADAVVKGAAALVVHDVARAATLGVPVFAVDNTLHALGALARYRRRAWGRPVIAIGGSNGKTSTKEMVKAALGARLEVHATAGNLNNQVGVPLTLLAIPDHADVAVVEMGTSVLGEMAILRMMGQPDIVIITSIGEEHLEGLGDLAGVLAEESALADGAPVVIVPSTEPALEARVRMRAGRVVTAGLEAGHLRADHWNVTPDGRGSVAVNGIEIRSPLLGAHNLRNLMLALAAAQECGVSIADAGAAIARMPPPTMRSASHAVGKAIVINDAYNANPGSTRAALDLLAAAGPSRQRVAILGTMLELGGHAERLHREMAERAMATGAEVVAGVGEMAIALGQVANGDPRVVTSADPESIWHLIEPRLAPDALILLKASRGVRLERIVPLIEAWAARQS